MKLVVYTPSLRDHYFISDDNHITGSCRKFNLRLDVIGLSRKLCRRDKISNRFTADPALSITRYRNQAPQHPEKRMDQGTICRSVGCCDSQGSHPLYVIPLLAFWQHRKGCRRDLQPCWPISTMVLLPNNLREHQQGDCLYGCRYLHHVAREKTTMTLQNMDHASGFALFNEVVRHW